MNSSQHEYLYWASQEGETSVGVRMGKWKLVQYRPKKGRQSRDAGSAKPKKIGGFTI